VAVDLLLMFWQAGKARQGERARTEELARSRARLAQLTGVAHGPKSWLFDTAMAPGPPWNGKGHSSR
jgi:hypothetical protein